MKIVVIPDENLAKSIQEALELSEDADITVGQLATLESLYCSGGRITDWAGMEYATQFINIVNTVINVAKGAANALLWGPLSDLVNKANNNLFVGDPNLTEKYDGKWNLVETWQLENGTLAAPRAIPMSLVDYPPFQRLSPEAQVYLLQLLEKSNFGQTIMTTDAQPIPETTSLLPNYPNPFNPETWIPYQLAAPADVSISIYAANGTLVRTLDLGHQPVGMYQSRNRAAHWDDKNAIGETVASGVYFYTFTVGDFSATCNMLILK